MASRVMAFRCRSETMPFDYRMGRVSKGEGHAVSAAGREKTESVSGTEASRTMEQAIAIAPRRRLRVEAHRSHLDRAEAHRRDALGETDRLVEVLGVDQVIADQVLLGLGEGTIGDQ